MSTMRLISRELFERDRPRALELSDLISDPSTLQPLGHCLLWRHEAYSAMSDDDKQPVETIVRIVAIAPQDDGTYTIKLQDFFTSPLNPKADQVTNTILSSGTIITHDDNDCYRYDGYLLLPDNSLAFREADFATLLKRQAL